MMMDVYALSPRFDLPPAPLLERVRAGLKSCTILN